MTGRELAGWVPTETHTHYDKHGNETGFTVVERESRIDDADRADLLALAQYEAELCTCGYHPLIANDKTIDVSPVDKTCQVCAGISAWGRVHADADEKAADTLKGLPPTDPRPWDGRHSYMSLTPQSKPKGGEHGNQA